MEFWRRTALAWSLRHRESHDIDIFLPDPQYLSWLSPRLLDLPGSLEADYDEQSNFVKIYLAEGEIDFILAGKITAFPEKIVIIDGMEVPVESPFEIMAKKIKYRGASFTSRDIFDLACMLHIKGPGFLRKLALEESELSALSRRIADTGFNPEKIMILPGWEPVRQNAVSICLDGLALLKPEK